MWNPPPAVTEHLGAPLAPDRDFFVAPPADIGAIRTAYTTLKKGVRSKPMPVRVAMSLAYGSVGFLLALGLQSLTGILMLPSDLTGTPPVLWEAILALPVAYLGWRESAFRHSCSFAGELGCAYFECEGERGRVIQSSALHFKNASALATRIIRRLQNGVYQGTYFTFNWFSADPEKPIFFLKGSHYKDSKTPPAENIYNFARAAESAWYVYLTPGIDAELTHKGSVKFYMGSGLWVALGVGFLQIMDKQGGVSRCAAEDIGSAKLDDGVLTIRRKDAKSSFFNLFNHEGVYQFNYATMHNARLFLYLFERCLGIKVR